MTIQNTFLLFNSPEDDAAKEPKKGHQFSTIGVIKPVTNTQEIITSERLYVSKAVLTQRVKGKPLHWGSISLFKADSKNGILVIL